MSCRWMRGAQPLDRLYRRIVGVRDAAQQLDGAGVVERQEAREIFEQPGLGAVERLEQRDRFGAARRHHLRGHEAPRHRRRH